MSSLQEPQPEDDYDTWVEVLRKEANKETAQRNAQKARWEAAEHGKLERQKREEYAQVVRTIRQFGGIRPYRNGRELEEWQGLPHSVKNRNGLPADEMAFRIADEHPWTGISIDNDLYQFLKRRPK